MGIISVYLLVNIQKAIEHGPVEIVDFPIKNGESFHSKMLVHQRVMEYVHGILNTKNYEFPASVP